MARRPPRLTGLGLDLDTSHGSLRTSTSTDLGASYNLTDEGVRLLSTSAREFHLNAAGHETRTRAERQQEGFGKRLGHGNAGGGGAKQGREDGRGAGGVLIPDSDRSPSFENEPGKNKTAQNKQQIVSSADILVFDTIGSGAGGSVRRAIHTKTHAFVALKVLTVFDKEKRKQLVNELRSLCDLANGNENIVHFHGAFYDVQKNTVNLTLEFVDAGSLEAVLKLGNNKGFLMPTGVIGDLASQVACGLEYLHEHVRLVHRDIKPGNVLLKRDGSVKITDFGIVAQSKMNEGRGGGGADGTMDSMDDGSDATGTSFKGNTASSYKSNHSIALKSFKGSLRYMSPERVERLPYGRAADIWSLGMTLSECALGKYPYEDEQGGLLGLALRIAEGKEVLPLQGNSNSHHAFPPEFVEMVTSCVNKKPGDRPTATMLRGNAFVKQAKKMSSQNPDDPNCSLGAFVRKTHDSASSIQQEAEAFLVHYRELMSNKNIELLASLYRKPSCLTLANGLRARGGDAVARALLGSDVETSARTHRVTTSVTALPGGVEGGILISCFGTVTFGNNNGTKNFVDTFLLLRVHAGWGEDLSKTGGTFYVRNQIEKWV